MNIRENLPPVIFIGIMFLLLGWFVWLDFQQNQEYDAAFQKDAQAFCLKEYGRTPARNIPARCIKYFK